MGGIKNKTILDKINIKILKVLKNKNHKKNLMIKINFYFIKFFKKYELFIINHFLDYSNKVFFGPSQILLF